MQTVTLGEAQEHLAELVRQLGREGELLITDAEKPVAKLSSVTERPSLRDLKPNSVGAVLRPFPCPEDDTLGEMLDARQ
ncbi:MAG: type II toxin-antitoxin system Phd/YefM family antitoxin [Verrucomicrobiota bacterium]|jgi:antitoxin (DNA-binding transcriptional repressor) of toxin-antitoxin stability system